MVGVIAFALDTPDMLWVFGLKEMRAQDYRRRRPRDQEGDGSKPETAGEEKNDGGWDKEPKPARVVSFQVRAAWSPTSA